MRIRDAASLAEEGNAKGVGGHIDQHPLDLVAGQARGHHTRPQRNAQVGMDIFPRRQSGAFLDQPSHQRSARRAADQKNRIQLRGPFAGVGKRLGHMLQRLLHQGADHVLIPLARYLQFEMQRLSIHRGQRLFAHRHLRIEAQAALGLLGGPPHTSPGLRMPAAQIDTVLRLKLADQMLGKQVVEVVAAQAIVAMAGQHLGDVAFQRDDGDVKGSPAQVVDHGGVPASFSIRQARRRRLVQDAHRLQAGQGCGLARSLALGIGEIGRNCNHRLLNRPAELAAGPVGQFAQNQCRDLRRRELPVAQRDGLVAAHFALDAANRAVRIEHQLIARPLAHQQFSRRGQTHHRGQHILAARTQNRHFAVHKCRNLGVRRTEIDANDQIVQFAHSDFLSGLRATLTWALR